MTSLVKAAPALALSPVATRRGACACRIRAELPANATQKARHQIKPFKPIHLATLFSLFAALLGAPALVGATPQPPKIGPRPVLARHYGQRQVASQGTVSSGEYIHVSATAQDMLQRFSPKDYYYVGIGHLPSKLIAFVQALSPELGRTFPASGLGGGTKHSGIDAEFSEYRRHIEALLPVDVLRGKRKILLVDYSSGPSLENFRYALKRYLKERGSSVKIETAAFYPKDYASSADHRLGGGDPDEVYDGTTEIAEFRYSGHCIGANRLEDLSPDSRWAADSGTTLAAVADLLKSYLATTVSTIGRARMPQIEAVGFGTNPGRATHLSHHIDIGSAPELCKLFEGAHKAIAPFEYYMPGKTEQLKARSEHDSYSKKLATLLQPNAFVAPLRQALAAGQ